MPPDANWHQYMIEFTDRASAAHTAARHLAPPLNEVQDAGLLHTWWYLRKTPAWRLRYQPTDHATTVVDDLLAKLTAEGHLAGWARGIYEPETVAFGGPAALKITHDLFHHDSRHLLTQPTQHSPAPALGQRETTVLLFSTLLRAAGQDRYEQGDVWAKVLDLRPTAPVVATTQSGKLAQAMRWLMTVNPRSVPGLLPEPWVGAFETAGHALADLTRCGRLERGVRAVLAHHFIFHANRAGLPADDQARMASLAVNTVFTTPNGRIPCDHPTRDHEGPTT